MDRRPPGTARRTALLLQAREAGWSGLTMSVNLSGGQLGQPDPLGLISSALGDADLKPEHLQLQMIGSVLTDDAATTITILQTPKGLAVRPGVDDFGTGFRPPRPDGPDDEEPDGVRP